MRSAYEDNTDHGERLTRSDVAAQLAAQTVQIAALTDRFRDGLEHIGARLDEMRAENKAERAETRAMLQTHTGQLQSLTAGQADLFSTRDRQRSIGRWVGGIVSAVVVAALVMVLGLRR